MNDSGNIYRDLYILMTTLAVTFTFLIAMSLAWNIHNEHQQALKLAKREALATFNKDQAFRLWVTKQGGVYVPTTVATPPSPYLGHIPERDIVTPSSRHLTLMDSAYIMRQVMAEYYTLHGVKGHLTSLKLLNPGNAPDKWEQQGLENFEHGVQEVVAVTELDGKPVLRLMQPMVTTQGCLKCHGIQGYRVGDVRGGLGITVPLAPYLAFAKKTRSVLGFSHGVIWLLGMTGIGLGFARGRKSIDVLTMSRENVRNNDQRLARLNQLSAVLCRINETIVRTRNPEQLYKEACRIAVETGGFRMAWLGTVDPASLAVQPVAYCGWDEGYLEMISISINPDIPEGRGPTGTALREKRCFINNDTANNPLMAPWRDEALKRDYLSSAAFPLVCGETCAGVMTLYAGETDFFREEETRLLSSLADDISLAMVLMENEAKRHQAEVKVEQQLLFLQKLIDSIPSPIFYKDVTGKYLGCNTAFEAVYGRSKASIIDKTGYDINPRESAEIHDRVDRELFRDQGTRQYEAVLQYADGNLHNVLLHKATFTNLSGDAAGLVGVMMDITELKSLEDQLRQQLKNMTALSDIGMAISSTFDVRVTLKVLLDRLISQLGIDAATVLLLDQDSLYLKCAASLGFKTNSIRNTSVRMGKGHAGQAAFERQILIIPDLNDTLTNSLRDEEFRSYVAVPLVAQGKVMGVLELFHRNTIDPSPDWLGFLELMAAQAAIAVDNATLFHDLQRTNTELTLAYDATLEGWGRTLELRDEDTKGHTERVTGMTVQFARLMGMDEKEIVQLRRGAMLHDIGKIGIPDALLLKPGPLSPEEREIMERHTVYAYELLKPIKFLHASLDIPYCHHEKWDGSGTPRGLKGEAIPQFARIFAVVDVWDALMSDRPYRPAWPLDKVKEYIRERSGTEFDPQVVETFFRYMEDEASEDIWNIREQQD